jgi:hypothetical protein
LSEARDTRFRKGQSGNLRGRPPKAKAPASVLSALLEETLTVKQNGVEREATLEDALRLRTLQAAMKGEPRAIRQVIKMIIEREALRAKRSGKKMPKSEVVLIRERDSDNAFEAMLLLGIAQLNPDSGRPDPNKAVTEERWPYQYDWVELEDWAISAAYRQNPGMSVDAELSAKIENHKFTTGNLFDFGDLDEVGDDGTPGTA